MHLKVLFHAMPPNKKRMAVDTSLYPLNPKHGLPSHIFAHCARALPLARFPLTELHRINTKCKRKRNLKLFIIITNIGVLSSAAENLTYMYNDTIKHI